MFDLKALTEAKTKIKDNNKSDQDIAVYYNQAISLLNQIGAASKPNKTDLQKAAELLSKCLEIKQSMPEPYMYLSYIFLIMKRQDLALKYFQAAKTIKPSMKGLEKLRKNFNFSTGNLNGGINYARKNR